MVCNKNIFIGFIKVGYKHLFIYDEIGVPMEINPLCVLDFYTYESCQRKGYGKIMFTEMLQKEKIEPRKMGYDRPSPKFINFLSKYFGLKNYVPQNNNFVVFKDYFLDVPKKKDKYEIYNNNDNSLTKKKVDDYNHDYNSNNNYNFTNENKAYNNMKDINKNNNYEDEKDFCTKIYKEYSHYNHNINNNANKELNDIDKEKYKIDNKRFINYHYRPSSSEYGAFFYNK